MYVFFLVWASTVLAKTHVYNFTASWIMANPDGVHERPVIGVNNQWPLPLIEVDKNDRLEIYLTNNLENRSTSLHFHGLFQHNTNYADGPEFATNCPLPSGHTILYNFTVEQSGMYWYHAHSGSEYGDGLRGPLLIHETEDLPFSYDKEEVITVSDWYHEQTSVLMKGFLNRYNPTGAEPIPQNLLINDSRNVSLTVEPNTTYFYRFVNMALDVSQYIYIEDHDFYVVEMDGVLIEPVLSETLYLSAGQRISILLQTKNETGTGYALMQKMDTEMLDVVPKELEVYSTNSLIYGTEVNPRVKPYKKTDLNPFRDFQGIPLDKKELLQDPDYQISVDVVMENLGDGVNYAFFNNQTYRPPLVPTLMTVLSSGDLASNPAIYGSNTNTFVLNHNEVIELVVNNYDDNKHPFHLHGHNFQIVHQSPPYEEPHPYDSHAENPEMPEYPPLRDTAMVEAYGNLVIRFTADNPGVWLFHCHLDWHLEQGLALTLVEAPLEIQKNQQLPENHISVCKEAGMGYKGNAAGNSDDFLDLHGENKQPKPLPQGFTPKGYFAFAFCSLVAVLGLVSIYQYGMEDVRRDEKALLANLYKIAGDQGGDEVESERLSSDVDEHTRLTS